MSDRLFFALWPDPALLQALRARHAPHVDEAIDELLEFRQASNRRNRPQATAELAPPVDAKVGDDGR